MYLAVIDTNVLVSALLSKKQDTATVKVLDRLVDGSIVPIYSAEILEEYNQVLRRDKFNFQEQSVRMVIEGIRYYGVQVKPQTYYGNLPDEKDRRFLEVTLTIGDCYLVTGNIKHFPKLPIVVTPAEMIKIMDDVKI